VSNREPGGWLADVLVGAQSARWCTRPFCTTCGCLEFRRAFWTAAARQAGIDAKFEAARLPRDVLAGVSVTDREGLVRTLVAGLGELPPRWTDSEAFRTIIIDLDPSLIRDGVPMALDTELSGTPAGEALARMRVHFKKVRAQRDQQKAYQSPQAVEERKRVKREKRASAHANRQSETRRRNAERLVVLAALAHLSPAERLSRFATDPALVLDCVPAGLIPAQELDLIDLEEAKAVALLARVGRRKGPWGRLRRMLERFAEPGSPT
jgi:hypothetical protein